ncbi:MAG: RNA polymerase sigma factor [Deferribacterales bacterium]
MRQNRALQDFFETNRMKLFGYLLKMTGNREDAEDIFQDTFIKYAGHYPDQQNPALLYTVARSLFLDMVRKRRHEKDSDAEPATEESPESLVIEKAAENRLLGMFARLPKEDRDILSMAGQDGLSYKQIAEILHMSEANVKIKVHRARIKLKKMTEAEDE